MLRETGGGGRRFEARTAWKGLTAACGFCLAVFVVSCGGEDHPALIGSVGPARPSGDESCATTADGCSCVTEGATSACGEMLSSQGEQVTCLEGRRTCVGGRWTTCSNDRRVTKLSPRAGGSRWQDLASEPISCEDPCNPSCVDFVDTPTGLDAGPGFTVDGGGLTLPEMASNDTCREIVIAPATTTVTVTSLDPIVTDPPQIVFRATCGLNGPVFSPTWSLTAADADVAFIESDGTFAVHAGVAKAVQVTASSTVAQATATVDVVVDVELVDDACAGVATAFASATGGADPGRTLYPYAVPGRPVVFPLGLSAPLVQWATGGVDADCVKVSLEYPAGSAAPTFAWSRVVAGAGGVDPRGGNVDENGPAYALEQPAWSSFDRSAQGARGDIVVQRHRAGAGAGAMQALRIPLEFASDALRGTVYYTQYVRRLHGGDRWGGVCGGTNDGAQPDIDVDDPRFVTSAASGCLGNNCAASSGPVCPVGVCTQVREPQTAMVQALDLAPGARPVDPFRGAATGCPVCHSVSANGEKFVANVFNGGAGIPTVSSIGRVNGEPTFEPYADAPAYSWAANRGESSGAPRYEQSWGLAYAALSPDGRFALQGPNFWGSTRHDMAIGQGNAQDAGYGAGGKRYFLLELAKYRPNVAYATTGPLPAHTATATTLTANASGSLSVDGTVQTAGALILIKDESVLAENGFYRVLDAGGAAAPFRLERLADADDAGEIEFGQKVLVALGNSNAGRYYHVAGNPSATITPGSSDIRFALYTTVMASTSARLPPYAVTTSTSGARRLSGTGRLPAAVLDAVPVARRMTILVKDETSANAASNGVYTLSGEDPWTLTRRADLDAGWEVMPSLRVRVNQGTVAGGRTFVLTTPAPVLDVTGLAFEEDLALDEGHKLDDGGTASTLPNMMYPVFSPDGRSLAYVSGDRDSTGASETGWRRGLGLLSFDPDNAATPFSAKRHILNTFSPTTQGIVFKWPFFEPDSQSLVYVVAPADEFCPIEAYGGRCSGEGCQSDTSTILIDTNVERACFQASNAMGHGNGAPTHRGYWPGRLHAVNSQTSADSELRSLNAGLGAQSATLNADAAKSYQPTVLPSAAGGYRWVIFTSTRAYGNQMNPVGTNFSCSAPLLWMAALDDEAAGSTDRSHPAFLLPGQNITSIVDPDSSRHFINERGYLVPSPCKELHAECSIGSECCGGSGINPSTKCLFDPDADPPHRTCEDASTCAAQGDVCATDGDCCAGALCRSGVCVAAPTHAGAIFSRLYTATCPNGYAVRWGNFEWHARADSTSRIDFSVQVAKTTDFSTSTIVGLASADRANINPVGSPAIAVNVQDALVRDGVASAPNLLVSMDFRPSSDGSVAPILYDWNQRYDCVAAE